MWECDAFQFYLLDLEEGRHLASRHECRILFKCILKYTISVLFFQNVFLKGSAERKVAKWWNFSITSPWRNAAVFYLPVRWLFSSLLLWRYNSVRFLAFSTKPFHLRRSWTCPFHFISFIFFRSWRWLSGLPIMRIGLVLRVNLSRILQNKLALKLPAIGSSTVKCYGLYNCKSGVVERFRRR